MLATVKICQGEDLMLWVHEHPRLFELRAQVTNQLEELLADSASGDAGFDSHTMLSQLADLLLAEIIHNRRVYFSARSGLCEDEDIMFQAQKLYIYQEALLDVVRDQLAELAVCSF